MIKGQSEHTTFFILVVKGAKAFNLGDGGEYWAVKAKHLFSGLVSLGIGVYISNFLQHVSVAACQCCVEIV